MSSYLDTLQGLRLIERVVPVTETQPHKSRRGIYRLHDHFIRFWFRFVHPNRSLLERGGAQIALDALIAPQLASFTGPIFEEICRQSLWRMGLKGALPFLPLRIGGWWRANQEIDVVAIGEEQALLLECKWSTRPVGVDILRTLEHKAISAIGELGERKLFYGLCARSGFTPRVQEQAEQRDDLLLFDLARIVAPE